MHRTSALSATRARVITALTAVMMLLAGVIQSGPAAAHPSSASEMISIIESVAGPATGSSTEDVGTILPVAPNARLTHVDATTLYTGSHPDAFLAKRQMTGGEQVLVGIMGPGALERYEFKLNLPSGLAPKVLPDGSVAAADITGQVIAPLLPKPWAKELKTGEAVPTHYETEGLRLFQVVQHHGFSYPIVADPYVERFWWGSIYHLNNGEARNLANFLQFGGGLGSLASKLPWGAITTLGGLSIQWAADNNLCPVYMVPRGGRIVSWYERCR